MANYCGGGQGGGYGLGGQDCYQQPGLVQQTGWHAYADRAAHFWASLHNLKLADLQSNLPLAAILLLLAAVMLGWAFWSFRRRIKNLDKGGVFKYFWTGPTRGQQIRTLMRWMFVFAGLSAAMLTPFLPGEKHWVPAAKTQVIACFQGSRDMAALLIPADSDTTGNTDAAAGANTTDPDSPFFRSPAHSRMELARQFIRELRKGPYSRSPMAIFAYQNYVAHLVPLSEDMNEVLDILRADNNQGLQPGQASTIGDYKVNGKASMIASCLDAASLEVDLHGKDGYETQVFVLGPLDDISNSKYEERVAQKIRDHNIHGKLIAIGGPPVKIPTYIGSTKDPVYNGDYKFANGDYAYSGYDENKAHAAELSQMLGWGEVLHLDPLHPPSADAFMQGIGGSTEEVGQYLLVDWCIYWSAFWLLFPMLWARLFRRRVRGLAK